MEKLLLAALGAVAIASGAFAGTETYYGKEMKPLPCPEWYADREFNVGIWGTYVFTGNDWVNDRYLETDHAWGGGIFEHTIRHQNNTIGSVLGTLTLRYPIPCTRFAPYIFGGGGAIFGGGQRTSFVLTTDVEEGEENDVIVTRHTGSETKAIGQVGGGIEVRFTPHIGWVSDFSWNFVDGPSNNFGMARTGVNFAF